MLLIRKLRLQKGWSQSELAQFSGLSTRTIQRIERGQKPGLETLKSLAAVFDLEVADFQQEDFIMEGTSLSLEEKRAFEYVQGVKAFFIQLATYVVVISGLFIINYVSNPEYIWAKWPAIGWGIGVTIHGIKAFGVINIFGPDWEKRQVEKRLGRKL